MDSSSASTVHGQLSEHTSHDKGKNIVAPLSIFEKGSTSASPNKDCYKSRGSIVIEGCPPRNRNPADFSLLRSTDYKPLKPVPNCTYCNAKRFEYEPPGFCCSKGAVKLCSHKMPAELRDLYLGSTEESIHFRTYIRTYNNMFAFTSLGVNYDKDLAKRNSGIYTFRVQGQMYHFIDDLYPVDKKATNLQLYFYDNDNELSNRMSCSDKVDELIVKKLMDILNVNPYSVFLKSLIDIPNIENFYIALNCDSGLDQRVYNLPSTSEVAAIWIEENDGNVTRAPHIRIYTHSNKTQIVNYYYGCYDALQYPLLFPYGQSGWHAGIKKLPDSRTVTNAFLSVSLDTLPGIRNLCSIEDYLSIESQSLEKGKRKRKNISVRQYYCYKLQMRNDDDDELLHTGRLFQQYSVDEYIKVETQKLDFVVFNQDLFRVDVWQGILDVLRLGERDSSNIGRQTFLPASFIGGP